jgi:hypothetical protein
MFKVVTARHFHRLRPESISARQGANRYDPPTQQRSFSGFRVVSENSIEALPRFNESESEKFFFISDTGEVYFGLDADTAVNLTNDLTENPAIYWRDLGNAFLLGMAVAHLSHSELSDCEPVALQLQQKLEDRR